MTLCKGIFITRAAHCPCPSLMPLVLQSTSPQHPTEHNPMTPPSPCTGPLYFSEVEVPSAKCWMHSVCHRLCNETSDMCFKVNMKSVDWLFIRSCAYSVWAALPSPAAAPSASSVLLPMCETWHLSDRFACVCMLLLCQKYSCSGLTREMFTVCCRCTAWCC